MYKYKDFSPTKIKNIVTEFSDNIYMSRETICVKYNISLTTFKSMIKNAILHSYVSLEVCYRIKEKSVSNSIIAQGQKTRKKCEAYYDDLISQRDDYKINNQKVNNSIIHYKSSEMNNASLFDEEGNLSGYNDYAIPDEKDDDE